MASLNLLNKPNLHISIISPSISRVILRLVIAPNRESFVRITSFCTTLQNCLLNCGVKNV